METNNSTELINQLSDEFSRLIVEGFTADQLKEVIAKNATEAYKNCCATQDYFDANEFMAEAFENITGCEIDVQDDTNIDLWNAAWEQSKSRAFTVTPCMSDLDENGDIAPYSDDEAKRRQLVKEIDALQAKYDKSATRNVYRIGNQLRAKKAELAALKGE